MNTIITNEARVGSFTSSEIYRLMKNDKSGNPGAPFYEYVNEKRIELRMGRSLDTGAYSRELTWGTLMEKRVFEMMGLEYVIRVNETVSHPSIERWAGSADMVVPGEKVSEIKCYYPKKFAQYTDVLLTGDLDVLRKDFPKEYWQMVSNAVINQVSMAEAVTYMPYQSELADIRELAEQCPFHDEAWKYRFIYESPDHELPFLPDGGYYKNLNILCFDVPKEDVGALSSRVELAVDKMNEK